jgi:hypothetical protein
MSFLARSARQSVRLVPLLLALGLLFSAGRLEAQFGGLVKKAKNRVAVAAGVQASTDQPARMAGPELTDESIERLLAGLKAEKAALDREAEAARQRQAEAERRQQAEERFARQKAEHESCVNSKMKADPDYAKLEQLSKEAEAAGKARDSQKAMDLSMRIAMLQPAAIYQRAEAACAASAPAGVEEAVPQSDAAAMRGAAGTSGNAGANAAGMTAAEYGQIKELVYTYFTRNKLAGLTPDEERAVNSRRAELRSALQGTGMQGLGS